MSNKTAIRRPAHAAPAIVGYSDDICQLGLRHAKGTVDLA